jgi:hypothetical protein
MFQAKLGSVSTGTLRHQDLLRTFADTLEDCMKAAAKDQTKRLTREEKAWIKKKETLIKEARTQADAGTAADLEDELLGELMDALEEYAPPYCYFGTIQGDGADFGFWPNHDAIDELPKIHNNSDEEIKQATHDGDDCVYVNDHGNLTIYNGKCEPILELV